jgi:hypothetical protein
MRIDWKYAADSEILPPASPRSTISNMRRLTILVLLSLATCLPACSRKQDAIPANASASATSSTDKTYPPTAPPFTPTQPAQPQHHQTADSAITEVATHPSLPPKRADATSNALPQGAPPANAPRSPAEIVADFKTSGDKQAALAAIRQLATNNPAAFPEFVQLLKASDPDASMLGAEGLASLGTKQAANELISAILNTPPGTSKRQLSAALANFTSPEATDIFLSLMTSSVPDRDLAAAAQAALGNSANNAILQQVVQRYQASNSAEERDNLVAAIRHSQNPECIDALLAILDSQQVVSTTEPLGLAAADTLGIIGTTNAVSRLFTYLNNLTPGDTSPVYDSIGRVSNPDALQLLVSTAYGQTPGSSLYSRKAAVQALGNYTSNLVAPTLNWILQNDPNASIKQAAVAALQRAATR